MAEWGSGKGTADTTVTSSNNNNMSFCWAVAQTALGGGGQSLPGPVSPSSVPYNGPQKGMPRIHREQETGNWEQASLIRITLASSKPN